jgi:GET complex subunit GET2
VRNPNAAPAGVEQNDPMMRMMQQMMGGADPNDPNAPSQPDTNDPLLKMMQQMMSGQGGDQQQVPPSNEGYIWRIVHAIFALGLAIYIATTSTFNGSKLHRSPDVNMEDLNGGITSRLFWIFATAEIGLQSTRYFVDKGRLPESGWLGMVGSVLPEPWKGYVAMFARYGVMWSTVVSDAMVVIFVLGTLAWWKGEIGA